MSRILGNFLQYFLFFRSLFWFIYLVSEPTVLCFPDTEDGHPLKIEHFIVSSSLLPFTELETNRNQSENDFATSGRFTVDTFATNQTEEKNKLEKINVKIC